MHRTSKIVSSPVLGGQQSDWRNPSSATSSSSTSLSRLSSQLGRPAFNVGPPLPGRVKSGIKIAISSRTATGSITSCRRLLPGRFSRHRPELFPGVSEGPLQGTQLREGFICTKFVASPMTQMPFDFRRFEPNHLESALLFLSFPPLACVLLEVENSNHSHKVTNENSSERKAFSP